MAPTAARRRAVRTLIQREPVHSQRQLVDLLAGEGFAVTQATVSRDLEAVGAVKERTADGAHRYRLASRSPAVAGPGNGTLARTLAEFAEEMRTSGNLVVVRTVPGAAHVVASAIDMARLDGVVGTVAGDDTLLVVAGEEIGGSALVETLERIGAGR